MIGAVSIIRGIRICTEKSIMLIHVGQVLVRRLSSSGALCSELIQMAFHRPITRYKLSEEPGCLLQHAALAEAALSEIRNESFQLRITFGNDLTSLLLRFDVVLTLLYISQILPFGATGPCRGLPPLPACARLVV